MRERILAAPLERYAGFRLIMTCQPCGEMRAVPVNDLVERLGRDRLFSNVLPRLKCRLCKNPPATISCDHHVARWPLKTV
jgi:hypothetical protein